MVYGVPLSPGGLTAPRTSSPGRREAARPQAGSCTTPRARGGFELPACSERSREPISMANPGRAHAAHPSHAAGSPSCQRSPEPPSPRVPQKQAEPGACSTLQTHRTYTTPEHFCILHPASPRCKRQILHPREAWLPPHPKQAATSPAPAPGTTGARPPLPAPPGLSLPAPQRISHTAGPAGRQQEGKKPHTAQRISGLLPRAPQKQAPKLLRAPQPPAGPRARLCQLLTRAPARGCGRRGPQHPARPLLRARRAFSGWIPSISVPRLPPCNAAELTPPRCRARRTAAERLRVARQRSAGLIFLLIKGRKISLFLNREKTTEGRAPELLLSERRDHRLDPKALSRRT